ncbi:MAG: ASPIC/UnbV domain-containing protein [Planctomycetota bacterium]
MASTVDTEAEESIASAQKVNSGAYQSLHNSQMFSDGLSFSGHERDMVWINAGGSFADLSALSGADSPNDGRAVITCDFDDDGDVDLFVHNIQRERHGLYRNDLSLGDGFLKLRLRGTGGNAEAVGATVVVNGPAGEVAQVLSRGGGFVTCQAPELVFGLGAAERASVDVIWPGGVRESFGELARGSRALLVEGRGEPELRDGAAKRLPDPLPPGLLVQEGDLLPRLAVRTAGGERAVLDVREIGGGKPVLLNLWASYCAPCVREIPDLQKIDDGGEQRVVAISMDAPGDVALAEQRLEQRGGGYPAYYLGARAKPADDAVPLEELVDLARLPIPTTLVLSPEGRVETILRGPLKAD